MIVPHTNAHVHGRHREISERGRRPSGNITIPQESQKPRKGLLVALYIGPRGIGGCRFRINGEGLIQKHIEMHLVKYPKER